jgi:hypothetical protein
VSGGDVRIEVRAAPGLQDKLQFCINGSRVDVPLQATGSHSVEDVIKGFHDGKNTLEVYVKNKSLREAPWLPCDRHWRKHHRLQQELLDRHLRYIPVPTQHRRWAGLSAGGPASGGHGQSAAC